MKKESKIQMMCDILNEKFKDTSCIEFVPGDLKSCYQIYVNLTYPKERLATPTQREVIRRNIRVIKGTEINKLTLSAATAIIAAGILCRKSDTNFGLYLRNKPSYEEPRETHPYKESDRVYMEYLLGFRDNLDCDCDCDGENLQK